MKRKLLPGDSVDGVRIQDIQLAERFASIADGLTALNEVKAFSDSAVSAMLFAADHGPLGYGAHVVIEPISEGENPADAYAEPLAYWLCEAQTMRLALNLLKAINSGTTKPAVIKSVLMGEIRDSSLVARFQTRLDAGSAWFLSLEVPDKLEGESFEAYVQRVPLEARELIDEAKNRMRLFNRMLGVPSVEADTDSLTEAWDRITSRPGGGGTDPDHAFQLEGVLSQARFELASLIDRKLKDNVEVRCANLEKGVIAPLPTNLLGSLYLALAYHIRGDEASATCDYRNCGKSIRGRKRVGKRNYCDETCRDRERRERDKERKQTL